MKFQMMEENSVIGMIQLEQMLQGPRSLFLLGFDIMNLDRLESDNLYLFLPPTGKAERKRKGREGRKHVQLGELRYLGKPCIGWIDFEGTFCRRFIKGRRVYNQLHRRSS